MKGFLSFGLRGYFGIASIVIIIGLSGLLWVKNLQLSNLRESLTICKEKNNQLLGLVADQNAQVEVYRRTMEEAKERSRSALKAATGRLEASKRERARLAELAKKAPPGPCPAGEAVKKIRESLP